MKSIIVEPMKAPVVRDIENNLDALQNIVGGYIEAVPIGRGALLICNEEGKLHDHIKKNRLLVRPYGSFDDMIYGTFIIVSNGGEDFASLTDDDVDCWLYRLSFEPDRIYAMY